MDTIVSATDNYLSLVLSLPNLSPHTVLAVFFLIMARLIPIMVLVPFLGSKTVPHITRIGFTICLVALLFPFVLTNLKGNLDFTFAFTGLFLKEIFIGFVLGFLASIPFFIAQASGSLIDHIRGSSSLQVTDPTTQSQTGPLGILYNYILIAVFFAIGGPFVFFNSLATSFQLLPVDSLLNPLFFSLKVPFWQTITGLVTQILALSIQLGAPAIIGTLIAEMFLGIANRLAPQVQIVFLGISLKSWIGIALLAAAWYFIMNQLGKESLSWMKMIDETIRQASLLKS